MPTSDDPARQEMEPDVLQDHIVALQSAVDAIRASGIDAVVSGQPGQQHIYSVSPADLPYRRFLDEMSDGAATTSESGRLLYANRRLAEMLGRDQSELLTVPFTDLVSPGFERLVQEMLATTPGERMWVEVDLQGRSGFIRVMLSSSCIDIDGALVFCLIATDLTAREEAQREIKHLSEALALESDELELVARNSPLEVLLAHLGERVERELRGGRCEVIVRTGGPVPLGVSVAGRLSANYLRSLDVLLGGGEPVPHVVTIEQGVPLIALDPQSGGESGFDTWPKWARLARRESLGALWMVPISSEGTCHGTLTLYPEDSRRPTNDELQRLKASARLAALLVERYEISQQLVERSLHDDLTGLPNRVLLADRLDQALRESARTGKSTAVLLLDLDGFKLVNDSLGHSVGDLLLREVARILVTAIRPGDTVARFGGDEFAIVCPNIGGKAEAALVAQRVLDRLNQPIDLDGRQRFVSASIGVALASELSTTPEELIRNADAAMYQAKDRGRSRFVTFNHRMLARAVARFDLESGIRAALEEGGFVLHYQPQLNLQSGRVVGFEALVRWSDHKRGLVPAADFISVAEESGLIVDLGAWVVHQACRDAQHWQREGDEIGVSVNLSARQLLDRGLVETVGSALRSSGLAAKLLCLEVTESVLVRREVSLAETLRGLGDLGVRLSIDDFGTGYASLAYLKNMRVDELKIDRTFVTGLGTSVEDEAIVAAITGLARALSLNLVAEGVETEVQAARLVDLGCVVAQGFLYAEAQPVSSLLSWLSYDLSDLARPRPVIDLTRSPRGEAERLV